MTDIQKAIKFAENEIKSLKLAPEINGCEMTEWWKEQIEVWETSISALEKQIPKKVELYTNDGNFKWKNYPCPCCREMLGLNVNKRYIKFCPNCGQALLWESEG